MTSNKSECTTPAQAHTPGPWRQTEWNPMLIVSDHGEFGGTNICSVHDKVNAELICRAPLLAEENERLKADAKWANNFKLSTEVELAEYRGQINQLNERIKELEKALEIIKVRALLKPTDERSCEIWTEAKNALGHD